MNKRQWTIRAFDPAQDRPGVQKLWAGVCSFDGSVPTRTSAEIEARLKHPAHHGGAHWRVVIAGNGAIVGALEVGFVGSVRTEVMLAVNPAWRRQGIGRALLQAAPRDRRLLVTSRLSVAGTGELLASEGFIERYREARMRRKAKGIEGLEIPDGAIVQVDSARDVERCQRALAEVFGDDAEQDLGLLTAWLRRPDCRALYLKVGSKDLGICIIAGSEHAKKSERKPDGAATIGVVEHVGLSKQVRGKGLSRPLVRAGMVELAKIGFADLEVLADRRRASAAELYEAEGFSIVDDDVHWIRREPWAKE
ncbi:MAG: GNAT family N-acetyltransferase [Deltaproteobacteria bacterium]|nr:GNAT family N-acetyltransferase [Deltaproteobacteria bacterium]